jgi:hypothetical protein
MALSIFARHCIQLQPTEMIQCFAGALRRGTTLDRLKIIAFGTVPQTTARCGARMKAA